MISASSTTVLGFSLTGGTIPTQDGGILLNLNLSGEPTGLSGIVVSNSIGGALDFSYDDGDTGVFRADTMTLYTKTQNAHHILMRELLHQNVDSKNNFAWPRISLNR